jgi:hypothetical protein
MKKIGIIIILFLMVPKLFAQNMYKTPSGKKYHLASCRMVKNVSAKLLTPYDIQKYHLTPCKICKPPLHIKKYLQTSDNKAVGQRQQSLRCKGLTKKGTRCKHRTKIANGYCFQHINQSKSN